MMQRLLLAAICIATSASVLAQETRTATISFDAPTTYADAENTPIPASGVAITYRVYQGAKGATKTFVATIAATGLTIDTGLSYGETCWEVIAVANGKESARSNEGCKTFEFPATKSVTITVR